MPLPSDAFLHPSAYPAPPAILSLAEEDPAMAGSGLLSLAQCSQGSDLIYSASGPSVLDLLPYLGQLIPTHPSELSFKESF